MCPLKPPFSNLSPGVGGSCWHTAPRPPFSLSLRDGSAESMFSVLQLATQQRLSPVGETWGFLGLLCLPGSVIRTSIVTTCSHSAFTSNQAGSYIISICLLPLYLSDGSEIGLGEEGAIYRLPQTSTLYMPRHRELH